MQAGGFSNLYQVDVPGTLTLTGTGTNTTFGMTINGGTLHAAATSTVSSAGGIGLGAATVNVDATKALTVTGSLNNLQFGTGSLTKTGAGSLILTGASTYTGPTTVNAGPVEGEFGRFGRQRRDGECGRAIGGTGTIGGLTLSGGTLSAGRRRGRHAERQRFGQSGRRFDVRVGVVERQRGQPGPVDDDGQPGPGRHERQPDDD